MSTNENEMEKNENGQPLPSSQGTEPALPPPDRLPELAAPLSPEQCLPEGEELLALISGRRLPELRERVASIPAVDLAELIDGMQPQDQLRLFRLLTKEQAAETFVEMPAELQQRMISAYNDRELSEMLSELYLDDTVDMLEEMPANVVKRILRNSSPEDRGEINRLLRYPKDSAGTIMTTEYVRFTPDMTVTQALDHIRRVAIDKETIYDCYVTDRDRHLLGLVTAKSLLISPLDGKLADIMQENVIFSTTLEDKEEVALKFNKYGFLAMPVVDGERRLVGIVTVDDAMDVMTQEAEEDFAKMAAVTPTETPYLRTRVMTLFRARIPWLLLLMISATFSSMILSYFEAVLPAVLVLFVPMLMDSGGNSGSQTSVTIIRGISVGEVAFGDMLAVVFKEVRVGIACGLTLGAVAFGKILLIDRLLMHNPAVTVWVALAVAITLASTIVIAKLVGCTLPLLAKKIGFDPAVMASPFLTTIVDAISLIVYFLIASFVFHL